MGDGRLTTELTAACRPSAVSSWAAHQPRPAADPVPAATILLEASEGRGWAAEVHSGPLQLVAALSTHLQIQRYELGDADTAQLECMLAIAGAAMSELRQLIARLEPPGGEGSLAEGLGSSGRRVLGRGIQVLDRSRGEVDPTARSAVLTLAHRALVEMRRAGGRAPGRIEVERQGDHVAVRITVASGAAVTLAEATLAQRARLAGGTAEVVAGGSDLTASIRVPCLAPSLSVTG